MASAASANERDLCPMPCMPFRNSIPTRGFDHLPAAMHMLCTASSRLGSDTGPFCLSSTIMSVRFLIDTRVSGV